MTENTSGADTSYEQALKSTGIVGGAQFLTILITVVKTKIVALLLGPAGVGVLGLLQGIVDMIRNATGLGIHFSAVKDVAAANGTDHPDSPAVGLGYRSAGHDGRHRIEYPA